MSAETDQARYQRIQSAVARIAQGLPLKQPRPSGSVLYCAQDSLLPARIALRMFETARLFWLRERPPR